MKARVVLRSGVVLRGLLSAWGPGWVELDGERWDSVVFWEVAR